MTENEAIENINALNAVCGQKDFYDEEFEKSLELAIQALEEIHQYRAIGTVRQVQDFIEDWRKFRELGNLEELKALKEKNEPSKVIEYATLRFVHWQCGNCGAEFYNGQTFCDECGHPADWGDLLK